MHAVVSATSTGERPGVQRERVERYVAFRMLIRDSRVLG